MREGSGEQSCGGEVAVAHPSKPSPGLTDPTGYLVIN